MLIIVKRFRFIFFLRILEFYCRRNQNRTKQKPQRAHEEQEPWHALRILLRSQRVLVHTKLRERAAHAVCAIRYARRAVRLERSVPASVYGKSRRYRQDYHRQTRAVRRLCVRARRQAVKRGFCRFRRYFRKGICGYAGDFRGERRTTEGQPFTRRKAHTGQRYHPSGNAQVKENRRRRGL